MWPSRESVRIFGLKKISAEVRCDYCGFRDGDGD
jgi:hypothetical protein